MMAGKTFNVGVIGYGVSSKVFQIPFIKETPQFKLYAIVQRSPKEGNSAPADYPDLKHYNTTTGLMTDPDVDVVVISTAPDSHFDLAKAALEAGKHVMCEKPFVPTVAEAEKLIAIARENKRLICVYQNRRWDSDFLMVKHLISEDKLGKVVEFHTHFDRYRTEAPSATWKAELDVTKGGSALFDLGTHLIDQVYTLFGMPQTVYGKLLNQREGRPEHLLPDGVNAQLSYANGMVAYVNISVISAEIEQPRFWVRGYKGSFRKMGLDPQEDALKAGTSPTAAGFGKDKPESMSLTVVDGNGKIVKEDVPNLQPETYVTFYRAFGKAVESGKEEDVPVKPEQARDVLKIIEAIRQSAKEGKDISL